MSEETLFELAVHTPVSERTALLDRECAGQPALRSRIEALLNAYSLSDTLDQAKGEAASAHSGRRVGGAIPQTISYHATDAGIGTVIASKYTLVELIGEGGMGSVWRAKQTEPVKRIVAVKLIKAGMDSKQVITRFEAERQALALMDHPHIAKVLDGGLHAGRPYFVMELVKGVPITEYCDTCKLTPKSRLELFVQACQAIQHAHQKGIIHRDIKPSNVLVALYDDKPVVKVIDFGVAKATGGTLTEKTLDTGFGGVVGTPQYMSPEQATFNNLDIDTRSDVYALGVLLYELLAGSPPFSKKELEEKGLLEILRVVREEEPPRPSTKLSTADALPSLSANRGTEPKKLTGLLRNELDWIVMKALEKDRIRRYETANGFAADVQRYLAGEPVLAHPPTTLYRVKKFVRRHKGQVIAASLVLFALLAGVVGTTLGLLEANKQTERAKDETLQKEEARLAAEAARDQEAKQRRYAEAITAFVKDDFLALTSVDGQLRYSSGQTQGLSKDTTLRDLLTRAAEKLKARKDLEPRIEAELCWIVGVNFVGVGQADKGIEFLRHSLELKRANDGPDHKETVFIANSLAIALATAGRTAEAATLAEDVWVRSRAQLGPDHPATLHYLVNFGSFLTVSEELKKAIPLLEEAVRLTKAKLGADEEFTLTAINSLAMCYAKTGQYDRAEPLYLETLAGMKSTFGEDHPDTLTFLNNLANLYVSTNRVEKALPLLEESLAKTKTRYGDTHPNVILPTQNLATTYMQRREFARARPLLEPLLGQSKKELGPDHPTTITVMNNLAGCLAPLGKVQEAITLYEEILTLNKAKLGPNHPSTRLYLGNLAAMYRDIGQPAKAITMYEKALEMTLAEDGLTHPNTLGLFRYLGILYWTQGMFDKAIGVFEKEVASYEKTQGRAHERTQWALADIGKNHLDAGRPKQAIPLLEEVIGHSEKHPRLKRSIPDLMYAYLQTGEQEKLIPLMATRLVDSKKSLAADSPQLANILAQHGMTLLEFKRFAGAEPLLRECLAIREKTQPDVWTTFNTQSLLGGALLGQKKYADAEPLLLKGYEGMKAREKTIPPQGSTRIPEALDRLVELYTATNKPDEAKKYQELRKMYPLEKEKK